MNFIKTFQIFFFLKFFFLFFSILVNPKNTLDMVVVNLSSYEFYLNDDQPAQITELSMQSYLRTLADGHVMVHGGRAFPIRLKRMAYELFSNLHDMFYHQPILTVCLFGVPLAFFSIIAYSVCSADFSVEREEIYPDDGDEDDDYSCGDEEGDAAIQIPVNNDGTDGSGTDGVDERLEEEDENNYSNVEYDEEEDGSVSSETELIKSKL